MEYVAPLANAGPGDTYRDRDIEGGIRGSLVPAAAVEDPQREIVAAIEAAGLVPDGDDLTQLGQAIAAMVAGKTMPVTGKTALFTAVAADKGKIFNATANTWTLSLTAAATLGNGWWIGLRNSGAGVITVDPDAAELVDGAATKAFAAGVSGFILCTGTAFITLAVAGASVTIPYDHPFNAGFNAALAGLDLAVQTYGEGVVARAFTATGEAGDIRTPAVGADAVFDIEKNGTTIYTTKPKFAAGANALTAGVLKVDGTEIFAANDRITFKCTQTGVATKGQKATFTLRGTVN